MCSIWTAVAEDLSNVYSSDWASGLLNIATCKQFLFCGVSDESVSKSFLFEPKMKSG